MTTGAGARTRADCIGIFAGIFADWKVGEAGELRVLFERALADFPDTQIFESAGRLDTTGEHWGYQPADPVATRLLRVVHGQIAGPGSELHDDGGLAAARAGPSVFLGNHLSFVDANTVDFLLEREGYGDVARRLTVLAGPKVFSVPHRRLASLCFGTVKLPQSPSRASGGAVIPRRETLRLARETLRTARERRERGEHLLIFSEGSRSRTGAMRRALPAVARYIEEPFATVVPFGVWGTEKGFPPGENRAYVHPVRVRIGRPIDARRLFEPPVRSRARIADAIGYRIAELLPPEYRGVYGEVPAELAGARELAASLD